MNKTDRVMKDTYLKRKRDRALYQVYVRGLREGRFTSFRNAGELVRTQHAPEFFIEPRVASLHIGKILSFSSLDSLHPLSRARIWELFARYMKYMDEHPGCGLTREKVLDDIIEEEAPEFYVTAEMARKIIMKESRKRREQW